MTNVAVIIPYFQRKPGTLRLSLSSVLAQKLPGDVRVNIIVVDDGSPVPARDEVANLAVSSPFKLIIVSQPNGGVAVARNTGLKHTNASTDHIAFLDSDDIWDPDHLDTALSALAGGGDYYFCDHERTRHHSSYFATIAFDDFTKTANARPLTENTYEINRDALFTFFLRTFVSQISTIVYRRSCAPDLFFNTRLRIVGEDHLFLVQLVLKSRRVCYSPKIAVTCGEGVNICAGKYSWDNPGHLIRYMGGILAWYEFRKHIALSPNDAHFVANKITFDRKCFAFLTTRYLIKKREPWPPELMQMTRSDPQFWLWYPLFVPYACALFAFRLFSPLNVEHRRHHMARGHRC